MRNHDKQMVSIILPTYKVEKYLEKSIRSILNQTWMNFELLVVVDDSPDNSLQIARSFSDPRIRVFNKPHGGLSDTRNYGLERARGTYVYFMDPDDWIDPGLLEDNVQMLEKEKLDFIVFGYHHEQENEKGIIESRRTVIPKVHFYKKGNHEDKIDGYHLEMFGYAWNKVYRKSFIDRHQFRFQKGISLVEDFLFNLPLFTASRIIRFNSRCYYHYVNRHRDSLIKKFRSNSFDLIKMKTVVLEQFANAWELPYKEELLGESIVRGINYCIYNIYLCKNSLSAGQREELVNSIVHDDRASDLIRYYRPRRLKDRLYKESIQLKMVDTLTRLALDS